MMLRRGSDVVITLDARDCITLPNTQIGQLSANNFQLALDTSKLKMTFDDEFNELDASPNGEHGWQTRFPGPAVYPWLLRTLPANHEIEYYSDSSVGVNPFSVSNGVLTITARPAVGPGVDTPAGSYLYYTSGVITTYHSFSQLYGYFEVRAELPSGKGFWPAFWLLPADNTWPPELDVFEQLGGTPDRIYHTLHSSLTVGAGYVSTVPTATTAYHTYGVDWEPTTITWYVDGTAVATAATPASMHKPMYMLVNLGVGGAGSPPGAADLVSSAAYHIDYVRAASSAAPELAAFAPGAGGWSSDDLYHRELADVNGDGKADIVGFGQAGVYVSQAIGNGHFAAPTFELAAFAPGAGGWRSDDLYHRELADVNGDGMADIVGFGQAGVYVSQAHDFLLI
jgi:beta-glucanase (GH16 family)